MSTKNKGFSKKADAPAHRNTPKPPADDENLYEFGRLVTRKKPSGFKIEGTEKTGKFEVVALFDDGREHCVLSSPSFDLARNVMRFCQDICNNNTTDVEVGIREKNNDISLIWDGFFDAIGKLQVDNVSLELLQSEQKRAKNLVDSKRKVPLIRFGSYAGEVNSIEYFKLIENGPTWAVVAFDRQGRAHCCDTGGIDSREELSAKMNEYIKLANQQAIDAEMRAQWSTSSAPIKLTREQSLEDQDPPTYAGELPREEVHIKARVATVVDADDDIDDKPQKVTQFQPGEFGQKRLLSASTMLDEGDDDDDTQEDEENKGVQLVDPATVKKDAPKDGKLHIKVPSANEGGSGPVDFMQFEANVLPNGQTEVFVK